MRSRLRLLPVLAAAGWWACGTTQVEQRQLVVYAAASLRDVAADLAVELERRLSAQVVYNFAGSNTLAQQILAAPGADAFLSADEQWMDALEQAGRIVAGTRRPFLSNRLVLIARRDAALDFDDPRDLAGAVNPEPGRGAAIRFLAVADPRAVPAGRYARAALERIRVNGGNLWRVIAGRVAPTLDVRAALALVESDPEIAGIVYRTDALTSRKVRVLYEFPPAAEAPVSYVAALVAGGEAPELGRRFLDFLTSPPARQIAERRGFTLPAP